MLSAQLGAKGGVCASCVFTRRQSILDSNRGIETSDFGLSFPSKREGPLERTTNRRQVECQAQPERSTSGSYFPALRNRAPKEKAPTPQNTQTREKKAGNGTDFMRFADVGERGTELRTAIVTYSKQPEWWEALLGRGPLEVDLVACVHIADKRYFKGLQMDFEKYDRVLYEMVTDKVTEEMIQSIDQRVKRSAPMLERTIRQYNAARKQGLKLHHLANTELGRRAIRFGLVTQNQVRKAQQRQRRDWKAQLVGTIQRGMAWALSLDFQLTELDYEKWRWRNADMDYTEFTKMQKERNEGLFSFAKTINAAAQKMPWGKLPEGIPPWKAGLLTVGRFLPMPMAGLLLIEGVCAPRDSRLGEAPEVKALLDLDLAAAMKVTLARQLSNDMFAKFEDASDDVRSSVIIGERNKVALKELKRAIRNGDRRIAIFYGSAHLPDIEDRLLTEFKLKQTGIEWRTAWRMTNRAGPLSTGNPQLEKFLSKLRAVSNWPLNRSQTTAIFLISLALATDLYFWELMIDFADEQVTEWWPVLVREANSYVPMLLDKMASLRV